MPTNALILSAGLGTRLKPFTDKHPKALALVNGKTVLERNILYLQQFGINNVIVNVYHFAEQIIEAIEKNNGWGSNVHISNESGELLETGGGIKKASWFLEQTENCVVLNCDILTDLRLDEMILHHQRNDAIATLATTNRHSSRYLLFSDMDRLCGWRNIKTGEEKIPITITDSTNLFQKAFSGIQILSKEIFRHIHYKGKFSMIDVYLDLCAYHTILSFDHSNSKFIDIGTPEKLTTAEAIFR